MKQRNNSKRPEDFIIENWDDVDEESKDMLLSRFRDDLKDSKKVFEVKKTFTFISSFISHHLVKIGISTGILALLLPPKTHVDLSFQIFILTFGLTAFLGLLALLTNDPVWADKRPYSISKAVIWTSAFSLTFSTVTLFSPEQASIVHGFFAIAYSFTTSLVLSLIALSFLSVTIKLPSHQ